MMAEGGEALNILSKILILGPNGHPDLEENLRISFLFRKIGYVSQDRDEDKTMVWIHSSEGTRKGEHVGRVPWRKEEVCSWGVANE